MFKFLIIIATFFVAWSAYSFDSGNYVGETSAAICTVKISQMPKALNVVRFKCVNKINKYSVGSNEETIYDFGVYSYKIPVEGGKNYLISGFVSTNLLSFQIYEEGIPDPNWSELIEVADVGKIHFAYKTEDNQEFDMILTKSK